MKHAFRLTFLFFLFTVFSFSQNYTSRIFSTDQGLPDSYVYCVQQDDEGFLWISTGKGLTRFDGQIFKNYPLPDNQKDKIIYSSLVDKNGNLWFGTFDGKIYQLDQKQTD